VSKASILALACIAAMGSCLPKDRVGTCSAISDATRVMVHVYSLRDEPAPDYVITDPARIHQLIVFANGRREVSQPALYTMPSPLVNAGFYHGDEFVGSIGAGPTFFFRSDASWKGIRGASATEIDDFKRLISPKY
jgi:hypothetical protein